MDTLMKCPFLLLPLLFLLCQCASPDPRGAGSPAAGGPSRALQDIVNVSSWDPKGRSRDGRSYSSNDVSALRANGAKGLIARAGKGGNLDSKCPSFLAAADRAGMLVGVYYRVQKHVDPVRQADQFVARARSLAKSRSWKAPALLLCGDYDGDLPLSSILRFMDRVEALTGVVPVAYLENSQELKLKTRAASHSVRERLRRAPYWLALYSHTSGAGPIFPAPGDPRGLVKQYAIWPDWSIWQYGGVGWENGAARAKVYSHGRYRFSQYFGNMDRPVERNVFRGSKTQLRSFWQRHGMAL
jgi:GH25 family lysozyme M1 (1,4-beta-N-acetylmuramidase)